MINQPPQISLGETTVLSHYLFILRVITTKAQVLNLVTNQNNMSSPLEGEK